MKMVAHGRSFISFSSADHAWTNGVLEPAVDIAEVFGEKPTELAVIFLHDDPEKYAHRNTHLDEEGPLLSRRACADRERQRTTLRNAGNPEDNRAPEGEAWPGNHKYADGPRKAIQSKVVVKAAPELESGKCGPSADLYFILEKFPSLGAICRLHTGSKTSVPNLSNAVAQLHSWNGGRLKWVRAVLKVTPQLRWHPGQFGEWESSVVPILSLRLEGHL